MLSVSEAQAIIRRQTHPLSPETAPLAPALLGLVLAEDVASDLDMPPYDKALMDGYAVRSSDLAEGRAILTVIDEITAGQTPRVPVGPGQAIRIMTGSPLPAGADAVVMIERTRLLEENRVQVDDKPPSPGKNVLLRGREIRQGDVVLPKGTVLRPQELGILATVGRTAVRVHPRPQVAVLCTGDEVVEPSEKPGPGQIRNGNGPMLQAQVHRAGGSPRFLGIARDRLDSLRPLVTEGLGSAVLVLSGGVSAGKLDLVPGVLQELGVQPHFHKVEMKPGKPVFFGTRAREKGDCPFEERGTVPFFASPTLVFGLPGNPVSALVCFELFVRPALRRLLGHAEPGPQMMAAPLAEDFAYRTDRPTYYPARLESEETGWRIRPVPWFGSSDLRGLAQANALVLFPAGDHRHRKGQVFTVFPLDLDALPPGAEGVA
jgi:molybdopterin molybdotransferase